MTIKVWRSRWAVGAAAGLVLSGATAHHSFAMFDRTQRLTLEGTVRNFEFGYPHTWLWLTVPDGTGGSDIWGFENASPVELNRLSGWTKTSVRAGDKITIVFCPLKNGKHGGTFVQVTLPDGRMLAGQDFICPLKVAPANAAPASDPTTTGSTNRKP